jgi:hypothetical protein
MTDTFIGTKGSLSVCPQEINFYFNTVVYALVMPAVPGMISLATGEEDAHRLKV